MSTGGGTVRGILDAAALLALAVYLAIVSRFHTPELGDTLVQMLLRFTSSICGCYVVIRAVFASWREDSLPAKTMKVMGAHSLELYYFHSLFIPYIPKMETPLLSPKGLGYLTIYFGATLGLCELLRLVVCASPYVALVIMGKPIKNRKD